MPPAFSWFGIFYKYLCLPSVRAMNTEKNQKLSDVLDEEQTESTHIRADDEQGGPSLYEEQVARLKAEADAQDKANRLRVAQEQLAEYALQKQQDTDILVQHAEDLHNKLSLLLQQPGQTADVSVIAQHLEMLRDRLSEAAVEAKAFAAQQTADVESLKRSSVQADLTVDGQDVEMKRARDSSMADSSKVDDLDSDVDEQSSEDVDDDEPSTSAPLRTSSRSNVNFSERAKYIPIRLTHEERHLLRLLEAALHVSEYTDKVDIVSWKNKSARIHAQVKIICAILSGLVVADDYQQGQKLIKDRNFLDNAEFFQRIFEIGRRYKIMNPDRMRAEYGKLMYMLMDSSETAIQELLDFNCVAPLNTVYNFLHHHGALQMLEDPLMNIATAEIIAGDRSRYQVQGDIKRKEKAREVLAKRYRSSKLSDEHILQCLYSISDNNSFLLFNRDPIDRVIDYFHAYFKPDSHEPGYSLAIQGGREGARLTHNHERQYHYVLQSLTLWREISTDMFKLWYQAESDMLREGNRYRLCDTGQGLNRVQPAPLVSKAMHDILSRVQHKIGNWVGSSVVHLGDHNVPNALMFIDKYTQVPRILNPVVLVMDELPKLAKDPNLRGYIDSTFGGVEQCRKSVLVDFCRHAFDGSGADNFFDAGSCIDGRLTSAWNWCSKIEKKPYYHIFKVAGFVGFDGDWKG